MRRQGGRQNCCYIRTSEARHTKRGRQVRNHRSWRSHRLFAKRERERTTFIAVSPVRALSLCISYIGWLHLTPLFPLFLHSIAQSTPFIITIMTVECFTGCCCLPCGLPCGCGCFPDFCCFCPAIPWLPAVTCTQLVWWKQEHRRHRNSKFHSNKYLPLDLELTLELAENNDNESKRVGH